MPLGFLFPDAQRRVHTVTRMRGVGGAILVAVISLFALVLLFVDQSADSLGDAARGWRHRRHYRRFLIGLAVHG